MQRVVKAHTPLGESQLVFRSMRGTEGLSQLFEFEVDLLSPSASLDLRAAARSPTEPGRGLRSPAAAAHTDARLRARGRRQAP